MIFCSFREQTQRRGLSFLFENCTYEVLLMKTGLFAIYFAYKVVTISIKPEKPSTFSAVLLYCKSDST